MDSAVANEMGVSFGVTVTSVKDSLTFIATNYNGDNTWDKEGKYRALRYLYSTNRSLEYQHLQCPNGIQYIPFWEM